MNQKFSSLKLDKKLKSNSGSVSRYTLGIRFPDSPDFSPEKPRCKLLSAA
jgi:hypothetical protein